MHDAGLSSITEGLFMFESPDWNWTYILGLYSSGVLLSVLRPESFGETSPLTPTVLALAGVLTGFGTRLSGGCTSGHGLCGLARRSPRSLVAVLTFMTTGALSANFLHLPQYSDLFTTNGPQDLYYTNMVPSSTLFSLAIPTLLVIGIGKLVSRECKRTHSATEKTALKSSSSSSSILMHLTSYASGIVFGLGLGISGMCNPDRVSRFLDFSGSDGWDPTLASVLGGGVLCTFLSFHYFKYTKTKCALTTNCLGEILKIGAVAPNTNINSRLVLGAALFGCGWGMAGMCPGPALVSLGASVSAAGTFVPSMIAGMILKDLLP